MNTRTHEQTRKAAETFALTVILASAALLVWTWTRGGASAIPPVAALGFWLTLSLAAECFWVPTPSGAGMISMSLAVNMATLFVLPGRYVLAIGAATVTLSDLLLHRRGALRATFNGAQTLISLAMSLGAIRLLSGPSAGCGPQFLLRQPLATLAAPVVFFAVNTCLVSTVIGLNDRLSFVRAWRENFGFAYQFISSATLFFLGLILVVASETIGYISGIACLLFFFVIRDAYGRINRDRAARTA